MQKLLGNVVAITALIIIGGFILAVNAVMFVIILTLKVLLPASLYWKNIKYFFTQYHWQWLLYKWGRISIVFEGESEQLPIGERALIICNHQDDLDFGAFILVYRRQGIYGTEIKWVTKKSIAYVPFFGWVHWLIGDLYLNRSYEQDARNIEQWLSTFSTRHFKRIVIFPEGTRSRNKKKLLESQQFAKDHGLKPLEHVLLPRTKGFSLIASYCRAHPAQAVDYIHDYTFGYGGGGVGLFRFLQGPVYRKIHVHVTRHKISDIGTTREDFAAWCMMRFEMKDKLMEYFNKHGHFPSAQDTPQFERDFQLQRKLKS